MRGLAMAAIGESSVPAPTPVSTPGIYHNVNEGLISLSSDGTNWTTIADKNLGATQVYNNGDALSAANCGNYYQRGNNYGFSGDSSATITKSSTQVSDVSNYGPSLYYYSDTFITNNNSSYPWFVTGNDNLWGFITGTNEAMQGPSSNGFHVPMGSEWQGVYNILVTSFGLNSNIDTPKIYLKMPAAGRRYNGSGSIDGRGSNAYYWEADSFYTTYLTSSRWYPKDRLKSCNGLPLRCFKNTPVQPDTSRTVLYQPSS